MTLRSFADAWNRFFLDPIPTTSLALFRIFYGLLAMAALGLTWLDIETWFSDAGPVPKGLVQKLEAPIRASWLNIIPADPDGVRVVVAILFVAAFCLTIGLFTRVSAAVVWMGFVALQVRNPYILHSGDVLQRIEAFFLMMSPAGAALSVDRWLLVRHGQETGPPAPAAPWAQRLVQIQICLVYGATVLYKSRGHTWADGTAIWYALHVESFQRFPLGPLRESRLFSYVLTWATLAIEFSLATLIWFRELRLPLIAAGVCLHLGIEYCMNIPLFEWLMIASLILFLEDEHLPSWIRTVAGAHQLADDEAGENTGRRKRKKRRNERDTDR